MFHYLLSETTAIIHRGLRFHFSKKVSKSTISSSSLNKCELGNNTNRTTDEVELDD